MDGYKINRHEDIKNFVATHSYNQLLETFQRLPKDKGHIIHVVGAPGTGKSTNIYTAIEELDLNFYKVKLALPSRDLDSRDVFNLMIESIKEDLRISSSNHILPYLGKFDAVLFVDQFHDSHLIHEDKVGFSQWTDSNTFKPLNFYLTCINEYLKRRRGFKNINMVLQTAWRIRLGGEKRDIFTDIGPFSSLAVALLGVPFEVVEISYSEEETINIVKSHLSDAETDDIRYYIKKYGNKPRFICQAIKTGE
jgi:hypothetical protein